MLGYTIKLLTCDTPLSEIQENDMINEEDQNVL